MRIRDLTLACMIAASICSAASAAEPDPLESAVYWRMEFGAPHKMPILGYGFALHHGSDTGRAAPALVQFDVSRTGALARLTGIPLSARSYKLGQTDEAGDLEPETEQAENTPWYARQWVWWTGAGLAATAAALSSDDPDENNQNNINNGSDSGSGGDITGVGPGGIGCIDGECIVPCEGGVPVGCVPGLVSGASTTLEARRDNRRSWLDSGTGQMGDLTELNPGFPPARE